MAKFGIDIRELRTGKRVTPNQLMTLKDPSLGIKSIQQAMLRTSAEKYKRFVQDFVKRGMVSPPLSLTTKQTRTRGSGRMTPIYDTGTLINSLEVKMLSPSQYVVGIPMSNAVSRPGANCKSFQGSISNSQLAQLNMKKRRIRVTHQMAKFFKYMAAEGIFPYYFMYINRGATIDVPARPFMKQAARQADKFIAPINQLTAKVMSMYIANFFSMAWQPLSMLLRMFR
jgi:hypothetical protein